MSEAIFTPAPAPPLPHSNGEVELLRAQLREALSETERVRTENRRVMREFAREVRVPLASVLGFTDLLSVTHKGNPAELNEIARAGHQLMNLVTSLEEDAACEPAVEASSPNATPAPAAPVTRTVLHIEDNETNFRLIERILDDRVNITPLWACDGEEGLAAARQNQPALILLDLNLPDIHGSEVIDRLKSNPATASIPVIVVSADISAAQIERMLQKGARNYLTKPFDIKRLLCLVDEALASVAA